MLRESLCMFPTTARMFRLLTPVPYNSALAVRLDAMVCAAFAWNVNYHPANALQRLRPTSAFLVLRKAGPSAT